MAKHTSVINLSSAKRKNLIRTGMLVTLFLSICIIVVTVYGQNVGNFVISVEQLSSELGLTLSDEPEFLNPTVRLYANSMDNATNISGFDIPKNIVEGDGNKNHQGKWYMAYSFYLKNTGTVKLTYSTTVKIIEEELGVSHAIRLWVVTEKVKETSSIIYAKQPPLGEWTEAEMKFPNSKNIPVQSFEGDTVVEVENNGFEVGEVTRYTIILWLEGDDPECIDNILNGYIRLEMNFKCLYGEKDE